MWTSTPIQVQFSLCPQRTGNRALLCVWRQKIYFFFFRWKTSYIPLLTLQQPWTNAVLPDDHSGMSAGCPAQFRVVTCLIVAPCRRIDRVSRSWSLERFNIYPEKKKTTNKHWLVWWEIFGIKGATWIKQERKWLSYFVSFLTDL